MIERANKPTLQEELLKCSKNLIAQFLIQKACVPPTLALTFAVVLLTFNPNPEISMAVYVIFNFFYAGFLRLKCDHINNPFKCILLSF